MYSIEDYGAQWVPWIALIPLLGALINGCFGKRLGKRFVSFVGVVAPAAAFFLTLALLLEMIWHDANPPTGFPAAEHLKAGYYKEVLGTWISVGGFEAKFSFVLDRLSAVMVLVITGVGSLIHLYSTAYMSHEDQGGYARYFTYLNLFVGSMLILVLAGDLLLMFVGWEGVGLCSYLLIGFEYKVPDNAACGTKAFLVNRIGDLGFVLGMLTLLVMLGLTTHNGPVSLDMANLNATAIRANEVGGHVGGGFHDLRGLACLLLFIGATGKSAQLPLQLWLPDAMAGPTPVSALIHAATMVTAGVYMIARLNGLYVGAEVLGGMGGIPVLGIVALVGVVTAFYAGTSALAQDDIKRVLAYSTVSQLGYMFVGVGVGAFGLAVFHLVTHAFFKALLFLGAGAVIHGTGTQSMNSMGGLRRYMPVTFATMLIGGLALGGLPLLSGFFSKDAILGEVLVRSEVAAADRTVWLMIYVLGVVTAACTALYSMRMLMMTFTGTYRGAGVPHRAPSAMAIPLIVLAGLALCGGLLNLPWEGWDFLVPYLSEVTPSASYLHTVDPERMHSLHHFGLLLGTAIGVLGVVLGWWLWRRPPSEIAWERPQGLLLGLKQFLLKAWMYDELVNKQGIQPATKFLATASWRWIDDKVVDQGAVDGTGRVGLELSNLARSLQTGRLSRYAGYFALGAVVLPLLALFGNQLWQFAKPLLMSLFGAGN